MTKARMIWRKLAARIPRMRALLAKVGMVEMTTITRAEFGYNLRNARDQKKINIALVAAALRKTPGDIERIEDGLVPVSTWEFERLVELYGAPHSRFLAPAPSALTPTSIVYRSIGGHVDRPSFEEELRRSLAIYAQMSSLKNMLGIAVAGIVRYGRGAPTTLGSAIAQGLYAAKAERTRLGLHDEPIADLAALIEEQGVDVMLTPLPDAISGIMLAEKGHDAFIMVRVGDPALRRNFTLAHEYAHVLFDRDEGAVVTEKGDAATLRERRANAFAASFLIPDAGVHAHLRSVGKGRTAGRLGAYGKITSEDVVALATRFRVSGEVMALKLDRMRVVRNASDVDAFVMATRGKVVLPDFDHAAAREPGKARLAELAGKAFTDWKISEGKLREILKLSLGTVDGALKAAEIELKAFAHEKEK